MNFEQTLEFLGNVNKAVYGVNPYQNVCSDLVKKGMDKNEVEMLAHNQGIDCDHINGFDDEFSSKENQNDE